MLNIPLVLLYHAVCSPATTLDSEERDLIVKPESFAEQMTELSSRGYQTLSLDEYASGLFNNDFPSRSLLLTFDDAYSHIADVVTPILMRHSFTAVMFASWSHLGGRNSWDDQQHPNLGRLEIATPELLKEMVRGPWEVASHGMHHTDLTQLEPKERQAQLTEAREHLSELLGTPVRDLAYPYGTCTPPVRDDARLAGYRLAFVAETLRIADPFQLPRLPIKGGDTPLTFRLKTSSTCGWLYERAPTPARGLARGVLRAASLA